MIARSITEKLEELLIHFPAVTLTGCRQCGKSTLLKNILPGYRYVSLEDIDIRETAQSDPRHFLSIYNDRVILDEIQRVPELLSYLQTHIDDAGKTGMYVLTGSHNLLLMESVSQSLAGRTALLTLAPFSIRELSDAGELPSSVNELLYKGEYPRIYDQHPSPSDFYESYIRTYIERDVRMIKNITDLSSFTRFLRLCAGRCGQILNITSLAEDAGITRKTAESWLSVLETGYVVYLLKPYYRNFGKRLVKSPKLYFYDTGLAVSLLGLTSPGQIDSFYMRGALFENLIVMELLKKRLFAGKNDGLFFWRDSNGLETDVIEEEGQQLYAYEIKSSETMDTHFFDSLRKICTLGPIPVKNTAVIYGGTTAQPASGYCGAYIPWKNI